LASEELDIRRAVAVEGLREFASAASQSPVISSAPARFMTAIARWLRTPTCHM